MLSRRHDGGPRGQIVLVAALLVAVLFVGLAVVLNSAIYAENLSSRETAEIDGALSFALDTDEAIAEAYRRTNRADSASADEARAAFNGTVDSWASAQQRRAAKRGTSVEIDRTPHVGWRLGQDVDGSFTPAGNSTANWQLADDARGVAAFELNVSRDDLYDASSGGDVNDSFHVTVGDGTDWELYVFRNGTHVVVHAGVPGAHGSVDDLPEADTCAADGSRAVIDFRATTLDGTDCDALEFPDDVSGSVDVRYGNGDRVDGTYALVVNGSSAAVTGNFDDSTGTQPTARAVIYAASYDTHYGRSDVSQERARTYTDREATYAT